MEEIGENYAPFACRDSFVMQAQFNIYFYTPHNEVVGGYTGFTLSVRL